MKNPMVIKCEKILVYRLVNGKRKRYSDADHQKDITHLVKESMKKYEKQDPNLVKLLQTLLAHFVFAIRGKKKLDKVTRNG